MYEDNICKNKTTCREYDENRYDCNYKDLTKNGCKYKETKNE